MRTRWMGFILACALAVTTATGCKPGAPANGRALDALTDSLELEVGDTAVVLYTVFPEGTPVLFESSDPDAFTVTDEGEVRGISGGEGHVILTAEDLTARVAVRVVNPEEEAPELAEAGAAIKTDHIVLKVGETYPLDDAISGPGTDDPDLFVEIGDFNVIGIDGGLLIALAPGETTVFLYDKVNFDQTLMITVVRDEQPTQSLLLAQGSSVPTAQAEAASGSTAAGESSGAAGASAVSYDAGSQESSGLESPSDATPITTQVDVDAYAQEVVRLVNRARASEGLPALSAHSGLMSASHTRAKELVTLYSHNRPDGTEATALATSVTGSAYTGENIAKGYKSPGEVMKGWMNSSGHRANILREGFDQIGVGCYQSGGTLHWVQLFSGPGSSGDGSSGDGAASNPKIQKRADLKNSTLSASSLSLDVGETHQLRVNFGSTDTKDVEVVWEAEGGVAVSSSGLVTAISSGAASVDVIIYFEEIPIVRLSCRVTVSDPNGESSADNGSGGAGSGGAADPGPGRGDATDGGAADPGPDRGDTTDGGAANPEPGRGDATDGGAADPDPNEGGGASEPGERESTPSKDEEG